MAIKRIRKILLTTLGLLPMFAPVDNVRAAEGSEGKPDYLASASELPWRKARLSLEAQTGTRTIGTLDAMIPFMGNDDFIVYADLMAKGQTNKAYEGNLGLGFRRVNDAETGIFGMYAFYDVLKSVNNHQFTQVTVGAEHLGLVWDFRANVYLPVGKTKYVTPIYEGGKAQIVEHNIVEYIQSQEETLSYGGDVEIGRIIGSNKLRGYVAMYTFGENLTGPRARLEYQMTTHLTLNTAVQHDQTRGTQYFVGARFTIGGARGPSDSIYTRLTDQVVRDIDVVTKTTIKDTTQIAQNKFWMVDQGKINGGTGTIIDPYASVEDAINNAPEGAIIYVKGVDGTVSQINGAALKQGQTLWGGSDKLYWDFVNDRVRFAPDKNSLLLLDGNGIRPTISGTLIANSNVGFYNLNLLAKELARDATGITVDQAKGVNINNVSVSGFSAENGRGIAIMGDSQVSMTKTTVNNSFIGIDVDGSELNVSDALTINQSQFSGLRVQNAQVTADSMAITNNIQYGLLASGGHITIQNDLAVSGGASGVFAQQDANIKANSVHLTNSNLVVDDAHLQIAHDLNVSGDQISVSNGGSVQSDIANITTQNMNFNQGIWHSNHGAVAINGANEIGLWLQNSSQVQLGATRIAQSTTSIQVDNSSLTLTDNLTTDNNVALNDAIMNLTNTTFGNSLKIVGAKSQLNSSGAVTVAQDLTINQGMVTANDLTLKGKVDITQASVKANNALNIDAPNKEISLTVGGQLIANSATVTTGSILIDNAVWSLTKAAKMVNVTNDIVLQNSGKADFGAATVTAKNINITSVDSQLTSSGILTVANNVSVTDGKLNGQTVAIDGNIDLTRGYLSARDNLTVNAKETAHIVMNTGSVFNVAKATITTGTIDITDSMWGGNTSGVITTAGDISVRTVNAATASVADFGAATLTSAGNVNVIGTDKLQTQLLSSGAITSHNLTLSNAVLDGQALTMNGGITLVSGALMAKQSLTVNDVKKNGISIDAKSHISTGTATIATGNIAVNGNFTATGKLTISNSNFIDIASGITMKMGDADITTGWLNLDGGHLVSVGADEKLTGKLTVDGTGEASLPAVDGISLSNNSSLNIGSINTSNNTGNGLNVNGGAVNAITITAANNFYDGILVNMGSITTNGLVTSQNNGLTAPTVLDHVGHGLEVKDGTVKFQGYKGNANSGDGINQSGGSIEILNATDALGELNDNKYHDAQTAGGNGFVKTGGKAQLANFKIQNNAKIGVNLALKDPKTIDPNTPDFIGNTLDIENNLGVGIFLFQGNAQFKDINVIQNNADPASGETKKYFNQVVVQGNGDAKMRTLNIIPGANKNTISSGIVSITGTDKMRSAVLIDSDATVNIQNADISNNTDGYGVWVDAGTVTLTNLTSQNNQRGVVFTQGNLTIKNSGVGSYSDISKNSEYGILVQDIDSTKPKSRSLLLQNVYLTNTGKGTSKLRGVGYGLTVLSDTQVTFDNSGLSQAPESRYHIADNAAGGIYIASSTQPIALTGLSIFNNVGNGIDVNSTAAITLNIKNSVFGNAPKTGETAQQNVGVNVNADALTMMLDNVQITQQKMDGINVLAKNDISATIQNDSVISNNIGAGLILDSKLGSIDFDMTGGNINSNKSHGIKLTLENNALNSAIKAKLTNLQLNDNGQNNNTYGLFIDQKYNVLNTTVNLTSVSILNNKNYGVVVAQGGIGGKITGDTHIQPQNIINGARDDWSRPLPP